MAASYIRVGDYKINNRRKLGAGTFGTVFKGKHVSRGTEVAAKTIWIDNSAEARSFVMREVDTLSRVKHHPFLLHMLDHKFEDYRDEDGEEVHELWVFTELCLGGNLSAYHRAHHVPFSKKVHMAQQCASAIAFLHNLRPVILHRDLKPGNILIKPMQGVDCVKIADFGLAQSANRTVFTTVGGSLHYMAPELFGEQPMYRKDIDVFSLGVVFGYFFKAPSKQDLEAETFLGSSLGKQMWQADTLGQPLPTIVEILPGDSPELKTMKSLILNMTEYRPQDRLTSDDLEMKLMDLTDRLPVEGQQPAAAYEAVEQVTEAVAYVQLGARPRQLQPGN